MKQHNYSFEYNKDVNEDGTVAYCINLWTSNHACYQEVKDAVYSIVTQYEDKEAVNDHQNQVS